MKHIKPIKYKFPLEAVECWPEFPGELHLTEKDRNPYPYIPACGLRTEAVSEINTIEVFAEEKTFRQFINGLFENTSTATESVSEFEKFIFCQNCLKERGWLDDWIREKNSRNRL